jgi:hypothetical protein
MRKKRPSEEYVMQINEWLGCDAGPLYDPMREASLSEQQRRERKLAAAKGWLGQRYLLHPANRVQRKQEPN